MRTVAPSASVELDVVPARRQPGVGDDGVDVAVAVAADRDDRAGRAGGDGRVGHLDGQEARQARAQDRAARAPGGLLHRATGRREHAAVRRGQAPGPCLGPAEHRARPELHPLRRAVADERDQQRGRRATEHAQQRDLPDPDDVLHQHGHPDQRRADQRRSGPDEPRHGTSRREPHADPPSRHLRTLVTTCSVASDVPAPPGRRPCTPPVRQRHVRRTGSDVRAPRSARRHAGTAGILTDSGERSGAGRATRRAATGRRASRAGTRPRRPARAPPSGPCGRAHAAPPRRTGSSAGSAAAGGP